MKYSIEIIDTGLKIKNATKNIEFDILLSESINLSDLVEELAVINSVVDVDYSELNTYLNENKKDDGYSSIIALGRMIKSIFVAHSEAIKELNAND